MPRARTKQELLDFGSMEYEKLTELVSSFSAEEQTDLRVFDNRSIKDVLAHLTDWLLLVFAWEEEGKQGHKPAIPAAGYTWNDLPAFNEMLYQKSLHLSLEAVVAGLQQAHMEAMDRIAAHTEEDLETKGKLAWTKTTSLASYYASCTSSHYVWASGLIRKLKKKR